MSKVTENKDTVKSRYRIKNWSSYNRSLKQRDQIRLFLSDAAIKGWQGHKTGKRGGQFVYSDLAIEAVLLIKSVYKLAYRQTEGMLENILEVMGLELGVPSYTQVCRRAKSMQVSAYRIPPKGGMDLVIDSTGVKIYGEGEWKVRKHGWSKRRTWLKVHLGIDPDSGYVHCVTLTGNEKSDSSQIPDLLAQVKEPVRRVMLDGAYDTAECWDRIIEQGAQPIIPPRENARLWYEENPGDIATYPRNVAIEEIEAIGRAAWKHKIGYHRRSLAETSMFRLKTIFGDRMYSRTPERQQTEIIIKTKAPKLMTAIGMPGSVKSA